ncbi:N-6 DNA methylase [Microbispora bryophytorum]|uniref:SAM-dependent methyltransferase n=1 Tax=Microbispora bryophytorum TaxID=1460882 RepID=A0A8H9LCM3_9ACTN|nr:N-6 DNA methylase [Microbispora bryophytorum]MBD3137641.1 N-6 DNA methylase [Microbispora bryophytorum]TQS05926.1 N-6 DNA methylase [Microbispora bryophytorum]GGO20152.1 SAM-dependent methyltransferase [Microbispora bryophytorum]
MSHDAQADDTTDATARPAAASPLEAAVEAAVEATVNAGDIARLADVGRAAVSNWRRRYEDFPQPVGGTASSPLFSLPEVEAWLRRNGKSFEVSQGDRVWQRLRASADDLRLGEVLGEVGAFLLYTLRDPVGWKRLSATPGFAARLPGAVAEATADLPRRAGDTTPVEPGLLRLVAGMAERNGAAGTFEFLCERYAEAHSRRLALTRPDVAALMTRLACPGARTVLDPACGMGTLLLDAAGAGGAGDKARLLGQDANETVALLAALRLLLRGRDARVVPGDALRHDAFSPDRPADTLGNAPGDGLVDALVDTLVDAVVCDPPFNERAWGHEDLVGDPRWQYGMPPRGEPELAWVQHCLAHVRPGGLVAVLMPGAAASRRPGRRVRANLLRTGALRAVFTLAPGGPDLWLLRRPEPGERQPGAILVADAGDDPASAEAVWRAHLAKAELPPGGRTVRIIDILDDEVDVSPARHLSPRVDTQGFPADRERFRYAIAALADDVPDLEVLTGGAAGWDASWATVAEMARSGLVTIRHSTLRALPADASDGEVPEGGVPEGGAREGGVLEGGVPEGGVREGGVPADAPDGEVAEGGVPVLTADDVAAGTAPSRRIPRAPGLVVVRPGDVVASAVTARVVAGEGAVLGPHLSLFRVDPGKVDPEFLAGFLRYAAGGGRPHLGSSRVEARRARVPQLPLAVQRAYGAAFRRLLALEDGLREVAAMGEALARLGVEGLIDGRLRPRG